MNYLDVYIKHLGNYKTTGKEYLFDCPWCHGIKKLNVDRQSGIGLYYCFVCCNSGNVFSFLNKMGDAVTQVDGSYENPVKQPEINFTKISKIYTFMLEHAALGVAHKEFLKNRKIDYERFNLKSTNGLREILLECYTKADLIEAGLFYSRETDDGVTMVTHGSLANNRIILPYTSPFGVTYFRSRASDTTEKKYLGPLGIPAGKQVWGTITRRLMVTEGELKAMAACQAGRNCVALPGMNSSHQKLAELCDKYKVGEVIICFDSQVANGHLVDAAAKRLANTLKPVVPTIKRLRLPLINTDKEDIDSFIARFGQEEFLKLEEQNE